MCLDIYIFSSPPYIVIKCIVINCLWLNNQWSSAILCLIDVVDMWVYSRFFFSAVVVYLADFTCIVYGECICNQGVCDIDCVIYKFFCKVCDGRWNNRCPKIRGILASCLWSVYFSFWEKIFFLRVLDAPNWYENRFLYCMDLS